MFSLVRSDVEWREIIERFALYDFYHSYDFHRISEANGEGVPVLAVAQSGDGPVDFCWPMLERTVPGTGLRDLTSVYGYPGPLYDCPELFVQQYDPLCEYLRKQGYISLFSRLNPFVNSDLFKRPFAKSVTLLGNIVAIELIKEPADFLAGIRHGHRSDIIKMQKANPTVFYTKDSARLCLFQKIYRETMDYLRASESYYYPDAYLDSLLSSGDFDAWLAFLQIDGEPAAAALIVKTGETVQYHLGATARKYYRSSPIKFLLQEIRGWAADRGCRWFVLGGGVGSKEDSLFEFKAGFSNHRFRFGVIKQVLDQAAYEKSVLINAEALNINPDQFVQNGYFPAYRITRFA